MYIAGSIRNCFRNGSKLKNLRTLDRCYVSQILSRERLLDVVTVGSKHDAILSRDGPFEIQRTVHKPFSYLDVIRMRHFSTSNAFNYAQVEKPPQDQQVKPASDLTKGGLGDEQKKLPLWQRFKKLLREYWYVLVPVHAVTSALWFGSFYYLAKSGIDIIPFLEYLGASEKILSPLRSTGAGYFAVAYALFKIASPARYTVTLGGTTLAVTYLTRWGIIKPIMSGQQMKAMFQEKRTQLRSKRAQALAKMNIRRKGSPPKQNNTV